MPWPGSYVRRGRKGSLRLDRRSRAGAQAKVNGVDLGILVIVGFFAVMGLQRGFMLGLVDLLAFALALIAGARMTDLIASPLRERGLPNPLAAGAGFFIASVVTYAAIGLVIRVALSPLNAIGAGTPLGWVNGVLGLLPGALRGLALAAFLVIALSALPAEFGLRPHIVTSQLAEPLAISGREALGAGLEWAGIDPETLGLPSISTGTRSEPARRHFGTKNQLGWYRSSNSSTHSPPWLIAVFGPEM